MSPLRVYAGLNSGDTPEARAALVLQELIRVGGFERAILAVATPTATGYMEEYSTRPLEYLHRGDVATIAQQYFYMQSPFSLVFEPGYGAESARAPFRAVYGHWTTLPRNSRPRLYLKGLSLGSMSSEAALRRHEVPGDPSDGALWSGPPFPSQMHSAVTAERNP